MRRMWFAGAVVALCPVVASAVVTIKVDPGEYTYNGEDQVVSWEVYATNDNPTENERLSVFTLTLELPNATPNGIRFLIPPANERGWIPFAQTTEHPYVFAGIPNSGTFDPSRGSDYNTVRLAGLIDDPDTTVDISPSRSGLARIDVFVPKNSPFWGTMVLVPEGSQMSGPTGPIPVTGQSVAWAVLPEPATLGALGLAAPLMLLRRRQPSGVGRRAKM